jgi:hypothetical protein
MPPLVANCFKTLNIVGLLTIYVPPLFSLSKMNSRLRHMYLLHFGMVSFFTVVWYKVDKAVVMNQLVQKWKK